MNYIDPSKIGTGKQYEDSDAALKAEEGSYDDAAARLSEAQRYPDLPKVESPNPFKSLSGPVGPGRDGV